jgi:preprotein translocase subunit YajC
VIFYIFFIRPQQKEQKKRRQLLDSVEKGDRVRTIGGIFGKVTNITGDKVTLLIDEKNDVKIKILKRAVASIKGKTEDMEDEKEQSSNKKD